MRERRRPNPADAAPSAPGSPLRRQLALMLALAVAPAGGLAVVDAVRTYREAIVQSERGFLAEAVLASQPGRDALNGLRHASETLAAMPRVRAAAPDACDSVLGDIVANGAPYADAVVLDGEGLALCASDPGLRGTSYAAHPGFVAFRARPGFRVAPSPPDAGQPMLAAFAPTGGSGDDAGAVSVSMPAAVVMARIEPGSAGSRALVDAAGRPLFAETDGEARLLPPASTVRDHLRAKPALFSWSGGSETMVAAALPLLEDRIWLVASERAAVVHAGIGARVAAPIAAPILTWLLAIGAAYFAVDRLVVRHLERLARLVRVYGRGRLSLRPPSEDGAAREIRELNDAIGLMAGRLDERARLLREAAETNRVLVLEVYHRVRNNLQLIASLMHLQARRSESPVERETLRRLLGRLQALSLVHRQLEQGRDARTVRLDRLTEEIAAHLVDASREADEPAPSIRLDLDRITAPPDAATPFALFFGEAVAEVLSSSGESGATASGMLVTLRTAPGGGHALTVAGADTPSRRPADGFRRMLMENLARQMKGRLEALRGSGEHRITLTLPPGWAGEAA